MFQGLFHFSHTLHTRCLWRYQEIILSGKTVRGSKQTRHPVSALQLPAMIPQKRSKTHPVCSVVWPESMWEVLLQADSPRLL
jgi:hypothetical protein